MKRYTKDVIRRIKEHKDMWYQTIDFYDFEKKGSNECGGCGDEAWLKVRSLMPDSLKGLKILDLGCNAGILCVRSALEGAKATGIEVAPCYIRHSKLITSYFEERYHNLDITIIKGDICDIFYNDYDLGKFDIVLGISVLYHIAKIEKPEECIKLVKFLYNITDTVIARYKAWQYYEVYNKHFKSVGFKVVNEIDDKYRYLVKYEKGGVL